MTPTRCTWALSALALTLVLGACSTPDDLAAPPLAPQFGTTENDFGVDVAYAPSGSVFSLSEQEGYVYDEYGYEDGDLDTAILNRYSSDGKLMWSRKIAEGYCYYWDDCTSNRFRQVVQVSRFWVQVYAEKHISMQLKSDEKPI